MNDFGSDLDYSHRASHEDFWERVYEKAFPTMVDHMLCDGDTQAQRLGIDRIVHLSSGKSLYIDEKKRREVYEDICLEYLSNDQTGAPGWIEKELQIDYLAYAFMPIEKVYLWPWSMLRRAWDHYGDQWKRTYRTVYAKNKGYTTHSVAVPIATLRKAVSNAAIIDLRVDRNESGDGTADPEPSVSKSSPSSHKPKPKGPKTGYRDLFGAPALKPKDS